MWLDGVIRRYLRIRRMQEFNPASMSTLVYRFTSLRETKLKHPRWRRLIHPAIAVTTNQDESRTGPNADPPVPKMSPEKIPPHLWQSVLEQCPAGSADTDAGGSEPALESVGGSAVPELALT
jgi:hypothetical protein